MRTFVFLGLLLALLGSACGREEQLTYRTGPLSFSLEGPLFSGPNTAQANLPGDFAAFLQKNGLEAGQVTRVQLRQAQLQAPDSLNFDLCEQAVLQMVADQAAMTRLAVLNPVPKGQQTLTLQVSGEQEATPFFQQPAATVVVDLNLLQDVDASWPFTGQFEFQVTVRR